MRILVTGHRGNVGAPVAAYLTSAGHEVAGFDRADGDDVLDAAAVRRAARGCAAVVHAAALAHDTAGSPEDIMIAATGPSLAMAARFLPSVPVRDIAGFREDPWRSLFDHSAATRLLGWHPRRTWAARGQDT